MREAGGSQGQGRLCWGLPELCVQPAHSTRAAPALSYSTAKCSCCSSSQGSRAAAPGEGQTPARGATTESNLPSGDRVVSLERGCSHSMPGCPSQTLGQELPGCSCSQHPCAAGVGTILNPVCPLKAAQPVPVTEPQSCHQHCCACTEPGTCTELGEDTGAQQFPKGMFCPKLVPGTRTELSEGTETQHFSKGMFFPKVRLESCCSSPSY